ncbi:unnamed protein product [Diplocarpon coronariae]
MTDAGLPAGWEVRHSNSKNLPYYFNEFQKQSRWEPPEGTDTEKLKSYMAEHHSAPQITAESALNGHVNPPGKIRAGHLLVKHKDSRRPSSWREAEIKRTKEDAMSIILGHEQRIRSGQSSLGDLATSESDCSSARKRGDLGFFGRGDMQKEFEEAAFQLNPGEMSRVVETASGLHLIESLRCIYWGSTMADGSYRNDILPKSGGFSITEICSLVHISTKKSIVFAIAGTDVNANVMMPNKLMPRLDKAALLGSHYSRTAVAVADELPHRFTPLVT